MEKESNGLVLFWKNGPTTCPVVIEMAAIIQRKVNVNLKAIALLGGDTSPQTWCPYKVQTLLAIFSKRRAGYCQLLMLTRTDKNHKPFYGCLIWLRTTKLVFCGMLPLVTHNAFKDTICTKYFILQPSNCWLASESSPKCCAQSGWLVLAAIFSF